MDIQAQQAPMMPTYAWSWQSKAPAAPPAPRTIYVQPSQQTAFVNLPSGQLPSADDSQFTQSSRPAGTAADSGTWTGSERVGAAQPLAPAPRAQSDVQRIADHRMQLLAVKYAMKDSPGAEGEREVLARLKILNAKLAIQAPMVTIAQVSMLEEMARRSDDRAARRVTRQQELGLG